MRTGKPTTRTYAVGEAGVESVLIGEGADGDRWTTTVTLRAAGGTPLTDSRRRLPEEIGDFEPGRRVLVVRGGYAPGSGRTRCSVLPRTP